MTSASLPAATAFEEPKPAPEPDYDLQASRDADKAVTVMHDDLLRCASATPWTETTVVADVLIGADGEVRSVTTSGGASLGEPAMRCIRRRIERAKFGPVHGGGTRHLTIPLTFGRNPLDEKM